MTKGNAFIFGPKSLIPDDADYKIVLFSLSLKTKNKYATESTISRPKTIAYRSHTRRTILFNSPDHQELNF